MTVSLLWFVYDTRTHPRMLYAPIPSGPLHITPDVGGFLPLLLVIRPRQSR